MANKIKGILIQPEGCKEITLKETFDFYNVLDAKSIEVKRRKVDNKEYAIICDKYDDSKKQFTVIKEENRNIVEAIAGNVFVSNITSNNELISLKDYDCIKIRANIALYKVEGEIRTYLKIG